MNVSQIVTIVVFLIATMMFIAANVLMFAAIGLRTDPRRRDWLLEAQVLFVASLVWTVMALATFLFLMPRGFGGD